MALGLLATARAVANKLEARGWGTVDVNARDDMRDGVNIVIAGSGYVIRVIPQYKAGAERPVLGETTFAPDAAPDRIAQQIIRRICSDATGAIATMRELIASRNVHAVKLAGVVQAWRNLYPTARIEIAADKSSATVHLSRTVQDGSEHGDYRYVQGRLYASGQFSVDRSSNLPPAAAAALLGALFQ